MDICTCIYTYRYRHRYRYVYTCIYICIHTHLSVNVYTCINTCLHIAVGRKSEPRRCGLESSDRPLATQKRDQSSSHHLVTPPSLAMASLSGNGEAKLSLDSVPCSLSCSGMGTGEPRTAPSSIHPCVCQRHGKRQQLFFYARSRAIEV